MAYGTGLANTFPEGTRVLYFNLKDKDLPAPLFEIQEKDAEAKYQTIGTATRVEGRLISVYPRENEYQGKKIRSTGVVMYDADAREAYIVSIPYTYLGRNILNSLLGLKDYTAPIEIGVYKGKPTEKGKALGKDGFSSSAIRQNGELIYGKHEYKTLPTIPKVQVGDTQIANPAAIDAFYLAEVKVLQGLVKAAQPKAAPVSAGSGEESAPESDAPEAVAAGGAGKPDEDVPF